MILRPCSSATRASSGARAIEPSGCRTSHSTPAGYRPASCARSTVASVWPARLRTPPCCAMSGKTWPGIRMSSGRRDGSVIARTVAARSNALVPLDVDRDRERGAVALVVLRDHQRDPELVEALRRHRHADDAPAVRDHEVQV